MTALPTPVSLAARAGLGVAALGVLALLGACTATTGYGVGAQAERAAEMQQASRDPVPAAPDVYLDLIGRMQARGLYFASLAHIDAYEKQYGVSPRAELLRADALRMTGQPQAAAAAYTKLLDTPLAARGHRGLGLLAGAAGDFREAAAQLQDAVRLAPTDAATLSDFGYARLRAGDVSGARVPLMKAAELDPGNPRIISNVALYLLAQGDDARATALMDAQHLDAHVRAAIRRDALAVAGAQRVDAYTPAPHAATKAGATDATANTADTANAINAAANAAAHRPAPLASAQDLVLAPPLLQRFSQ
jgi:Flp pilus assembly protein TadD